MGAGSGRAAAGPCGTCVPIRQPCPRWADVAPCPCTWPVDLSPSGASQPLFRPSQRQGPARAQTPRDNGPQLLCGLIPGTCECAALRA